MEDSNSPDLGAAAFMAEHLRNAVFPDYEVGLLRGRLAAEEELKIRRPGEVLGTKQSGLAELRAGNILHQVDWLEQTRDAASALHEADPNLQRREHRARLQAVQGRWGHQFKPAGVGECKFNSAQCGPCEPIRAK